MFKFLYKTFSAGWLCRESKAGQERRVKKISSSDSEIAGYFGQFLS
jgi:hypothetical protein